MLQVPSVQAPGHHRRRLLVLRHGSRPDRGVDPPLDALGRQEAAQAAMYLAREAAMRTKDTMPIVAIYCSPFRRALETAVPVARALKLPICVEWGSCELLAR